jgi:hypothetical protein
MASQKKVVTTFGLPQHAVADWHIEETFSKLKKRIRILKYEAFGANPYQFAMRLRRNANS